MKILVTGNCGFIGQNFVRMFNKEHEIYGFDMMGYASDKNAISLCPTIIGDLSKKENVEQILSLNPLDAIIHFAAESHVDNSILAPRHFLTSNIIGTFNLLDIVRIMCVKKIIIVSTDEVYGELTLSDNPFNNVNLLKPSSPYSASKASADMLALSFCRTYGIDITITRCCNNYGKFQYKEKFIPVIILNALENKLIPIYGSGGNRREWINVEDHCKGIMASIKNGKKGHIYHIGSNIEMRNISLVGKILDIMKKPHSLMTFIEDRIGHDFRYALNIEKSQEELNWKTEKDFDEGLKDTIQWFIENPNYWS
jgi:dTDP-glucose 4,6-dehydratase